MLTSTQLLNLLNRGTVQLENGWIVKELIERNFKSIQNSKVMAICPHCQQIRQRSLGNVLNTKKKSQWCIECQREHTKQKFSKPSTMVEFTLTLPSDKLAEFKAICREKDVNPRLLLLSAIDSYIDKNRT